MPLPNKEDIKCYVFMSAMIFLLMLATFYYYYVIRFTMFIFFYWFISIPLIIICFSSIDFVYNKIRIRKAYRAINSEELQDYFKKSSGENPLNKGKLNKSYKKWLIQKVKTPKYKIKRRFRISTRDITGLIFIIVLLIAILLVFLTIYRVIFPNYRLPVAW